MVSLQQPAHSAAMDLPAVCRRYRENGIVGKEGIEQIPFPEPIDCFLDFVFNEQQGLTRSDRFSQSRERRRFVALHIHFDEIDFPGMTRREILIADKRSDPELFPMASGYFQAGRTKVRVVGNENFSFPVFIGQTGVDGFDMRGLILLDIALQCLKDEIDRLERDDAPGMIRDYKRVVPDVGANVQTDFGPGDGKHIRQGI
jgi:hypothetical protein